MKVKGITKTKNKTNNAVGVKTINNGINILHDLKYHKATNQIEIQNDILFNNTYDLSTFIVSFLNPLAPKHENKG